MTDDDGNVVWANYEYAWGGRYQSYYQTQSICGTIIAEEELQPIRFQGQFFDTETSLHYNRFRYYDSDVGMFIQRNPIGLLGGVNVYQYADNPTFFIDPFGLKKKKTTDFNEWLNRGGSNYSNYISDEYTGITNDFERRKREHNGTKGDIKRIPNAKNLTKNQARAIEQAIIHNRRKQNNSIGSNKINSVSPKRNIYNDVVDWGEKWLIENDPETAKKLGLPSKTNTPNNKGTKKC